MARLKKKAQKKKVRPRKIPPGHWDEWLYTLFPDAFTVPNAGHHEDFWFWVWSIEQGVRPRPYVLILARGGGKTTCGEVAPIMLGARGVRKYAWYISETQDQADKRIVTIADKLESHAIADHYPKMSERSIGKFGSSRGWSRQFLRTESDFVMEAVGLNRAARSSKVGDARPDILIFDDVDGKHDNNRAVEKKIETITHTLLPAATSDAVIIFMQNLIHPNSIASHLAIDGKGKEETDWLTDRVISGPFPALEDFDFETVEDEETGRPTTVITGGTPVWEGQSLAVCQNYIKTFGITSFRTECQHEVKDMSGGIWDDIEYQHVYRSELPAIIAGVVWVDPAVTSTDDSDCQGLQADGIDINDIIYRFKSYEGVTTPEKAIRMAILWALELGFKHVGVETNQGGDTWKTVYKAICRELKEDPEYPQIGTNTKVPKYHEVKVSKSDGSKIHRNRVMLADYELGQVVHVFGPHTTLEEALNRFPKYGPKDLVDASYHSWEFLRNERYKKKTASAH